MRCWLLLATLFLLNTACQQQDVANNQNPENIAFEVITHGEVVDLEPHIQDQGVTVFDFYADWCPPCKKLDKSLAEMKAVYGARLHIVKLDLVDWKSALAKHHKIADLPYLMVYDKDRNLIKKGPSSEVLPELVGLLSK